MSALASEMRLIERLAPLDFELGLCTLVVAMLPYGKLYYGFSDLLVGLYRGLGWVEAVNKGWGYALAYAFTRFGIHNEASLTGIKELFDSLLP